MKKDYYNILGVDKNFNEEQLKKAYKKQCLKYHPDRQSSKSDDERKKAEEMFKDVQEAYECLSDSDKRAHYDRFGTMDNYGQGWSGGADMFSHFSSFFDDFNFGDGFGSFFNRGGRQSKRGPEPGANLRIQVGVSLKELLDGGEKKFKYNRNVRCDSCHGTGGTGVETCPHCHGTGMITTTQRSGFGIIQNSRPCNHCNGTGQIIKNRCSKCHGEGLISKENVITVNIPQGCQNGYSVNISGAGCESKDSGGMTGDLQVIFIHNYDKNRFAIQGRTIYERIDIPYFDAILGCEKQLKTPNDRTIRLRLKECSQDGDNIYGDTINGFEYRYIISVSLPKNTSKKEREHLEKIRKIWQG